MIVQSDEAVLTSFVEIAHRVVWCSVGTVDRSGRPRSRVLHPLWEDTDDGMVGWIGTRKTPLKVAHLARTPFVSCLYRDTNHDVAIAECRCQWVADVAQRHRVWDLFRRAPVPLGYDPGTIWSDPDDSSYAVLQLMPWRISAAPAGLAGASALTWTAQAT